MTTDKEIRQQEFQDGFMIGRNDAILEFEKIIILWLRNSEDISLKDYLYRELTKLKNKELKNG